VVIEKGNPVAINKIEEAFEKDGAFWRGLGWIQDSGYSFKEALKDRDARNLEVEVEPSKEHPGCLCGEVLQGAQSPLDCSLFKRGCSPENPIGPCMVSLEGTCATYYKYL
jgi:hydrogenase expression/formation protein HypD